MSMGFCWGLLVPSIRALTMQKCKEACLLTKTLEPPHQVPHCRLSYRLNSIFHSHILFYPPSSQWAGNQRWFCFHHHDLLSSLVMGGSSMKLSLLGDGPGFLDHAEPAMCCRTCREVDRFCLWSWSLLRDSPPGQLLGGAALLVWQL